MPTPDPVTLEKPAVVPPSERTPNQKPNDQSQQRNEPAPKLGADSKPIASESNARDGSIYKDLGVDEPGSKGAATFPDNWREQLATGEDGKVDEAELKRLQRYQSPQAYNKSSREAARRLRDGEFKRGKPENATPEQLTAWRAENGIPESADAYELPLPAGVKFDQLDPATQESLKEFQATFHQAELAGPQAQAVAKGIMAVAEKQLAKEAQGDAQGLETMEDTLRADWGPDYRNNLQVAEAHGLKVFGDDFYAICKARMPDGRQLGTLPGFHKYLADQGRLDGSDEFVQGGASGVGTLEGRRQEIEKIMNTDFNRYQRENLSVEYNEIMGKLDSKGKLDPKK